MLDAAYRAVPPVVSSTETISNACGLDHKIGSITVGKQADLLLIDLRRLNTAPANDPAGAIVQSADSSNVAWVFIAGAAIKAAGRLLDTGATARALKLAEASRDHLYRVIAPYRPLPPPRREPPPRRAPLSTVSVKTLVARCRR